MFLISETGEQLGEYDLSSALKLAQEIDLDLVEIAPKANPPVAKIMSWSKFKYQQQKKRKETKGKKTELKEMWFKSFIDIGDLGHKIKKVKEFLKKKNPVKLTVRAKGRVSSQIMLDLMGKILTELEGLVEYDTRPTFQGKNLSLIVRPVKNKVIIKTNNEEQNQNAQG